MTDSTVARVYLGEAPARGGRGSPERTGAPAPLTDKGGRKYNWGTGELRDLQSAIAPLAGELGFQLHHCLLLNVLVGGWLWGSGYLPQEPRGG